MIVGQPLITHAADVLRWGPSEVYDIACTHSFIPQFPPARRKDLIAAWRRILRPGGRVLTTARINPAWTAERAGFAREQVSAFRALVVERARVLAPRLDIATEELAAAAEIYAERIVTHSLTSRDELVALFESGGFQLDRLDIRAIGGSLDPGLTGPTTDKSGIYAEIVAVRE
jgi:SAM-dependent methyltransferase